MYPASHHNIIPAIENLFNKKRYFSYLPYIEDNNLLLKIFMQLFGNTNYSMFLLNKPQPCCFIHYPPNHCKGCDGCEGFSGSPCLKLKKTAPYYFKCFHMCNILFIPHWYFFYFLGSKIPPHPSHKRRKSLLYKDLRVRRVSATLRIPSAYLRNFCEGSAMPFTHPYGFSN